MLHLSSPRPSRLVVINRLHICPKTSYNEALGCYRDTSVHNPGWCGVGGVPNCIYDVGRGDSYTIPWHVPDNNGDLMVTWAHVSSQDCLGCCVVSVGMKGITHSISSSIRWASSTPHACSCLTMI